MTYQTDSFLEKNRDYIVAEHCNLLSSSRCSLVSGLFSSLPEESLRSSYKFSSVASRFKVPIQSSIDFVLSLAFVICVSAMIFFHLVAMPCQFMCTKLQAYKISTLLTGTLYSLFYSNNFKPSWKRWARQNLTMFAVWSLILLIDLSFLKIKVSCTNFAAE